MSGTGARVDVRLGASEVPGRRRPTTLAVALSALALGAAALAPSASAAPGHLAGTWVSVDVDRSNQWMRVRGAGNRVYAMTYRDDFTTGVCGGPPAKVVGHLRVDGNSLVVRGTLVCLHRGNRLPGQRVVMELEYHPGSDTITDPAAEVVWVRAG